VSRGLWRVLGLLAVVCGAAGVVLPLVPTTPFLLLAAFAFARSSPRLEAWLLHHRVFAPMIHDWRRYGAIPRVAKISAVALMAATLGGSILLGLAWWIVVVHTVVLIGVATFVLSRPSSPSHDAQRL